MRMEKHLLLKHRTLRIKRAKLKVMRTTCNSPEKKTGRLVKEKKIAAKVEKSIGQAQKNHEGKIQISMKIITGIIDLHQPHRK